MFVDDAQPTGGASSSKDDIVVPQTKAMPKPRLVLKPPVREEVDDPVRGKVLLAAGETLPKEGISRGIATLVSSTFFCVLCSSTVA